MSVDGNDCLRNRLLLYGIPVWLRMNRGALIMNIERIAQAIENDAGESIEGLRESLTEMKAGNIARQYTPEQLL
jgi:hypothetical protein